MRIFSMLVLVFVMGFLSPSLLACPESCSQESECSCGSQCDCQEGGQNNKACDCQAKAKKSSESENKESASGCPYASKK